MAAIITWVWTKDALDAATGTFGRKLTWAFVRLALGLLMIALAADGVVAAMNWTVWLYEPYAAFRDLITPQRPTQRLDAIAQVVEGYQGAGGQDFTVRAVQPDGQELDVTVPQNQLRPLIEVAAAGFTLNNATQGIAQDAKFPFDISAWDIALDKTTNRTTLSVTIATGGRLDFALAPGMPEQMLHRLQAMLASAGPVKPPQQRSR